jgi:signal transduction histidine kinase
MIARTMRGEHPPPSDVVISYEKTVLTLRGAAAPLFDSDGRVSAVVVGFQDVSELRELAEAKDRFLRIAAHELRTPITSLRATTELLTTDPSAVADEARRATLLARIDRQSRRLLQLGEHLMDASRLHAKELSLQLASVDLTTICREAAEAAGPRARLEAPGPIVGRWDALRLEQMVTNLLSNALRYSAAPTVVMLRVSEEGERVILEVSDQGIGVPPAELGRVFEPFFQASNATGHRSGLGLGLHITSEIVRRHGGRIAVISKEGVGSTFTVELPR